MKQNKTFFVLLFWISSSLVSFGDAITQINQKVNEIITEQASLQNQKASFEKLKASFEEEKKFYQTEQILVDGDHNEVECFEIDVIEIRGSTLFDSNYFEPLKKPYLKNCNGIANLTNLVNKITNQYIDKGYVTSRAYFKQQDLTDGKIEIDILESKIEKIEFINSQPLEFMSIYENQILNLKDLEVELQQRDRLKSVDYNFELTPGTKSGYSIVKIIARSDFIPFYGSLNINNMGSKVTGKYQFGLNGSFENLFGFSDIIGINLGSTDNQFKQNNYSKNGGINFSFPIQKFLFDISYNYSKFNILTKDDYDQNYETFGNSNTISLKANYKLFHNEGHAFELNGGYVRKENTNYVTVSYGQNDDIATYTAKLSNQSYILANIMASIRHTYQEAGIYYFSNFSISKGLPSQSTVDESVASQSKFTKYQLDTLLSKRFDAKYTPTYNFSFTGQMLDQYLFATDGIYIGGPYSVRGFSEAGIAGDKGYFIRNDLVFNINIENIPLSPYIGLDYGYIGKSEVKQKADIIGSALGLKVNYQNSSLDMFYHKPISEDESIKNQNKDFVGFTFSYNFQGKK